MPEKSSARTTRMAAPSQSEQPRCGLCGKTRNLIRTECCGQWICDDEHEYVMFSYARNSCHRNHARYTLCAHHYNEQHAGDWRTCQECRESFETEMYVWYGTNEYNFEKLENPPAYEPTRCASCGRVIRLAEDGHMLAPGEGYFCMDCANLPESLKPKSPRRRKR